MDTHAARLHDPECTGDGTRFHDLQKVPQTVEDALQGRARPNFQHDDPCASLRRKPQYLTKIPVESDERSLLCRANLEQFLVGNTLKILIPNGHHIVAGCPDEIQAATSYILVELELHATRPTGTATTWSRAASAP
jgi:hypothetical protein